MIDIAMALEYLRPSEEWALDGDDYAGLTWLSDTKKPTQKEIDTAYPLAVAAKEAEEAAAVQARVDAIAHAKSLGFTDAMITVMYPNLLEA
tara:strand:- start:305 stop:577 length:273 start_codon:yes stop_codon:yes gene_type:complete